MRHAKCEMRNVTCDMRRAHSPSPSPPQSHLHSHSYLCFYSYRYSCVYVLLFLHGCFVYLIFLIIGILLIIVGSFSGWIFLVSSILFLIGSDICLLTSMYPFFLLILRASVSSSISNSFELTSLLKISLSAKVFKYLNLIIIYIIVLFA